MLSKNIKILIISGHGGKDSGAVYGNLIERDMNLICSKALYEELKLHGYHVDYEWNNGDVNYEYSISHNYDLVISVHFNSGKGDGFECFCNLRNNETVSICKHIEKRVIEFGQNSRGIKSGDNLKMVGSVKGNAILLEGGFIDNPKDSSLFDERHEMIKLGQAYAHGVMDYFGDKPIEKKEGVYRVVVGSYAIKNNALEMQRKLKEKGFDSFLVFVE